jgi:hypothetical protein
VIPHNRHGRAMALACTLAAAIWGFARDASVAPQDCGSQLPDPPATADMPCKALTAASALVAAAEPGSGIARKEQAASEAVLAFGEAAVPALLPL